MFLPRWSKTDSIFSIKFTTSTALALLKSAQEDIVWVIWVYSIQYSTQDSKNLGHKLKDFAPRKKLLCKEEHCGYGSISFPWIQVSIKLYGTESIKNMKVAFTLKILHRASRADHDVKRMGFVLSDKYWIYIIIIVCKAWEISVFFYQFFVTKFLPLNYFVLIRISIIFGPLEQWSLRSWIPEPY